jgi:hypothetical protein
MLLPTIKLIPQLETILLEKLIYDDWWHSMPVITPLNKKKRSSFQIKNKLNDLITNLCDYNTPNNCEYMIWTYLSCNPSAIELLSMFQKNICFSMLAYNTNLNAIDLIEANINKLYNRYNQHYNQLSSNPSAVDLLKKHKKIVNIGYLMSNPNPKIIDDILQNSFVKHHPNIWNTYFLENINSMDSFIGYLGGEEVRKMLINEEDNQTLKNIINSKVFSWYYLCSNPHPYTIKILKLFPEKISYSIVINPCDDAYELICNFLTQCTTNGNIIAIKNLCRNTNPRILKLLDNYPPDLYCWGNLCLNPAAISILIKEEHKHRIQAIYLFQNPNIFIYNYKNMEQNISVFKYELIQTILKPSNIANWMKQGYNEFLEYKEWVL